jgi:hypothetical protein
MASILFFFVLLVTVVVEPIVLGVSVTDNDIHESCEAQLWPHDEPYQCSGGVSVNLDCQTSKLNLTHTNISQICTSIDLFWSYPVGNLTMIIETPFSKKQQAYTIELNNERVMGAISHVYRLIDGKEIEVTTKESKLIQHSDSKYQVILKLQGPPKLTYYGVFIDYDIIKS